MHRISGVSPIERSHTLHPSASSNQAEFSDGSYDTYVTDKEGMQIPENGLGDIILKVIVHPVSLIVKAASGLIALLLS